MAALRQHRIKCLYTELQKFKHNGSVQVFPSTNTANGPAAGTAEASTVPKCAINNSTPPLHYASARNAAEDIKGHSEGMHSTEQFSREFTDDGLSKHRCNICSQEIGGTEADRRE